jgi:hypothetical protein
MVQIFDIRTNKDGSHIRYPDRISAAIEEMLSGLYYPWYPVNSLGYWLFVKIPTSCTLEDLDIRKQVVEQIVTRAWSYQQKFSGKVRKS